MHDKVDRLRRLLMEGFEVEGIESERGFVEATLRRGGERVVLRLGRADAARILYDAGFRVRPGSF